MLENIPPIGFIIITMIVFVGSISLISSVRTSGREEYGLNFFKSWQFCILSFSSLCFYISFSIFLLVLGSNDESAAEILKAGSIKDNLDWGIGSIAVAFGIALLMNIRKSTLWFGLIYTIAQSVASLFSILILCLVFIGVIKMTKHSA